MFECRCLTTRVTGCDKPSYRTSPYLAGSLPLSNYRLSFRDSINDHCFPDFTEVKILMVPASINNESRLADASSAEVTNDPVISVDSSEVALTATVKTDSEKNDPVDAVRTLHKDHGRTIHGTSQIACLPHMEGRRLWLLITVLCVGLLLSTLETTIVATALISISSELEDYGRSNWIVASYLLTYTGTCWRLFYHSASERIC